MAPRSQDQEQRAYLDRLALLVDRFLEATEPGVPPMSLPVETRPLVADDFDIMPRAAPFCLEMLSLHLNNAALPFDDPALYICPLTLDVNLALAWHRILRAFVAVCLRTYSPSYARGGFSTRKGLSITLTAGERANLAWALSVLRKRQGEDERRPADRPSYREYPVSSQTAGMCFLGWGSGRYSGKKRELLGKGIIEFRTQPGGGLVMTVRHKSAFKSGEFPPV